MLFSIIIRLFHPEEGGFECIELGDKSAVFTGGVAAVAKGIDHGGDEGYGCDEIAS